MQATSEGWNIFAYPLELRTGYPMFNKDKYVVFDLYRGTFLPETRPRIEVLFFMSYENLPKLSEMMERIKQRSAEGSKMHSIALAITLLG